MPPAEQNEENNQNHIHMEHPQLRLRQGIDKATGKALYINEVNKGTACNCKCPICDQDLVAKKGDVRVHHFAHCNGAGDCIGARMSMLHKLAQEVLDEEKQIMLPAYEKKFVHHDAKLQVFDEIKLEKFCKDEISRRRPDCIGKVLSEGIEIWIEIYCTNPISDERRFDIIRRKQYCVEVDFSDLLGTDYTREDVRDRLLNETDYREWICHPVWDQEEADKEAEEQRRQEEQRRELEKKHKAIEEALKKGGLRTIQEPRPITPVPQFAGNTSEHTEPWHIVDPQEKRSHDVPETPETRDWLMWIKSMNSDTSCLCHFLEKEYTNVNFENSHPFVVREAELKINELLVAITISHIEMVNMMYLECLIVLRVVNFLNRSKAYELGKIFVENEALRNSVLNIIKQLQSVTKTTQEQNIKSMPVFQESENKEAIMQILTICNILK